MMAQGTDPSVSRMLLGVLIRHNDPLAEFKPRQDATKPSPSKISRRQVQPLFSSEHASDHQLNTGRTPCDDWGHSKATYRTYMETNPGVTTELDHPGGVAAPPCR